MIVSLIFIQAFLVRLAGGGLFASRIYKRLPEIIFAVAYGFAAYQIFETAWAFPVAWLITLVAMETGHGTFYNMNGWQSSNPERKQTIEYIVRPIYNIIVRKPITHPSYSWACMGFKGFLIGLPLGLWAIPHAVLWPLAYHIGNRVYGHNEISEWLSGAFSGAIIIAALTL